MTSVTWPFEEESAQYALAAIGFWTLDGTRLVGNGYVAWPSGVGWYVAV